MVQMRHKNWSLSCKTNKAPQIPSLAGDVANPDITARPRCHHQMKHLHQLLLLKKLTDILLSILRLP